jgi:hypothetical protein
MHDGHDIGIVREAGILHEGEFAIRKAGAGITEASLKGELGHGAALKSGTAAGSGRTVACERFEK